MPPSVHAYIYIFHKALMFDIREKTDRVKTLQSIGRLFHLESKLINFHVSSIDHTVVVIQCLI